MSSSSNPPLVTAAKRGWLHQAARRAGRLWAWKTLGATVFMTAFFMAYLHVLKSPRYPVTEMPLTFVDRGVPFQPETLAIYLSLWVYVSLPMAFMAAWTPLLRYGAAMLGLCLAGLVCFYFWPTRVPALDVDWNAHLGFAQLHAIDSAGNACPSLHVAAAVCAAAWLHRLLASLGAGVGVRLLNLLWCLGIAYSTIATRQHVALDVAAGTLLALPAIWLSLPSANALAEHHSA